MQIINEISAKILTNHEQEFNLAIIVSQFNNRITQALLDSALTRLKLINFPEERITVVKVPGAVEIGLTAKQLASSKGDYLVIICLGAIIRGETDHYDYVCQQVSYACQKVALEKSIPIIFGILTTANEEQAFARINKGAEVVETAMAMVSILSQIGN